MATFKRVIEILDNSVRGADEAVGFHGAFWRNVSRNEFVNRSVFGFPLITPNDGSGSNLVKALKGEAPFGSDIGTPGATFRRMPSGMESVADADIAVIEQWIDEGAPADDSTGDDDTGHDAGNDDLPDADNENKHWRATNAPPASSRTDDIWFINPAVGWAVNSNGQILKTEDGGESWITQYHNPALYLRCIGFADANIGWVGTLSAQVRMLSTSDGGVTWNEVDNLPQASPIAICGLSVVTDQVIYASGTNRPGNLPHVVKTLNGGKSWQGIPMSDHATILIDCFFTSPSRGWVVGGIAPENLPAPERKDLIPVVLRTDDGGLTWTNTVAGISDTFPRGEWGWKIQFLDDQVGFISLENFKAGAILKTENGGEDWQRLEVNDPQGNANLEGIGFVDENLGWVGGWGDENFQGGFSSETRNGGVDWIDANYVGRFINRFRFFGSPVTVGYASGRTVYKYSRDFQPAAAMLAAPVTKLLKTNTPRVFDNEVRIEYNVPEGSRSLRIDIWDQFGWVVRNLIREVGPVAGDRSSTWDGTDDVYRQVPSGVYIYRLTINGVSESRVIRIRTPSP